MPRPENRQELQDTYGVPIGTSWGGEKQFMVMYQVPSTVSANWINTASGKPIRAIYLNKDMKDALDQALKNVFTRGLVGQLNTFDGCFMVRSVRGEPDSWSIHSYGLAIDINAATNKLGQDPTMSPELVKCFTDCGFTWGGTFSRKDGMHLQYAGASC